MCDNGFRTPHGESQESSISTGKKPHKPFYLPKPYHLLIVRIIIWSAGIMVLFYLLFTIEEIWRPSNFFTLPDVHFTPSPDALSEKNFPEKIFLHRVNSLERIRYAKSRYAGVEIDVFYHEEGFFDVRHPSTHSIALSLDTLLAEVDHPEKLFYWLDLKNLNSRNKNAAVKELSIISEKYNILPNIIIESSQSEHLGVFSSHGFYTSYYLPTLPPGSHSKREIKQHMAEIIDNLSRSKVNAVSANQTQYELITKYLRGFDILLWHFSDNPFALKLRQSKLLADPHVKILLVEDKSPGYR
jgi:heptose-I-phosphate ethanolaminephosphotransferase